jgi:hypothetical protein
MFWEVYGQSRGRKVSVSLLPGQGEITVGVMRRSRQKVRVILAKSTSFKIFRAVRK